MSDRISGPAVRMRGIVKRFGSTVALDGVDFEAHSGEINAVIGENGAGKSTLMHVLFGLHQANAGEIEFNGETLRQGYRPSDAIARGMGMLQQHFSLVPIFSALENIVLGNEPTAGFSLDIAVAEQRVREILSQLGSNIDPSTLVSELSVSENQTIEIARMIYTGARLMIFDEPTASLAPQEIERLYELLGQLAERGATIILITHRLGEVLHHCGRATVLRRGQVTGVFERKEMSEDALIEAMVAESGVSERQGPPAFDESAQPSLVLEAVECIGPQAEKVLKEVSLQVRPGEILGIAGVTGAGQLELAETIVGLREAGTGRVLLGDEDVMALDTLNRRRRGMVYVPEDRFAAGVIAPFSLIHNRLLGDHRFQDFRTAAGYRLPLLRSDVQRKIDDYDIAAPGPEAPMAALSGGNQQKLMLARELERAPQVIIAHGPTRGLDFAASARLYRKLLERSAAGAAIVLFSTELDDLLAYSHRIAVLYGGRLIHAGSSAGLDPRAVGLLMTRGEKSTAGVQS